MKIIFTFLCSTCFLNIYSQSLPAPSLLKRDSTQLLSELVVSASRVPEDILVSPISIQKKDTTFLKSSPAASFFDAIENIQGVQMITPSLSFKVINARGFANTTNVRFAQLVDGADIQSPHIGGPIGNALGPTDLDIENVEVIPGVASALYGMNTINGLANFSTRNPFTSAGVTILQKTAVTHLGDLESSAKIYSETAVRLARILSSKFALKFNGSFTRGTDWMANDHTDLNPLANASTSLLGMNNPAIDPVNKYGNESSDRKTLILQSKSYVVARTGYDEKDVVNYGLKNVKADAGLFYRLSESKSFVYTYRVAVLDAVYQRANRFKLQDYLVQQHSLQFKSTAIKAQVYLNEENTGKSYNLRSTAENIDRNYKPDVQWYNDYTSSFDQAMQAGSNIASSHRMARIAADAGRYEPGTPTFTNTLQKLTNINNWDIGSALRVKAKLVNAEMQFNLTDSWLASFKKNTRLELLAGLDSRTYFITPDGNYFVNPLKGEENNVIHYSKTGGFVSVNKTILMSRIKVGAIIRADKNDYFSLLLNPRFTAVYSPSNSQAIRFSFQSGYRFPSIFEAYSNINSGGVKRVGGLRVMSDGIFEKAWLQSSISIFQSAVLKDINSSGLSKNAAILKNKGLLVKNPYTYIRPEHIKSFEGGYKSVYAQGKVLIDLDYYFNQYRNFIAQVNMNVPNTRVPDSIPYTLYDKTKQTQYRLWTNSRATVRNYGISAGITYHLMQGYRVYINASFSKLKQSENQDGLEDGFNTPRWITNTSIYNGKLTRNIGAGVTWKWQTSYLWQSFLVTGITPAYSTLDAQVSYKLPKLKLSLKLGANNLLNHYYVSFLGGPQVGAFYYLMFTYATR